MNDAAALLVPNPPANGWLCANFEAEKSEKSGSSQSVHIDFSESDLKYLGDDIFSEDYADDDDDDDADRYAYKAGDKIDKDTKRMLNRLRQAAKANMQWLKKMLNKI
jgi:hypothetical protein